MAKEREIAGYRILQEVGEGAASRTYAVIDPKTKQVRALKHVIKDGEKDQRFIDQILVEYDVGSRLDHENIRGVERVIKHRKRFKLLGVSLIMELVDGEPLDQRLPTDQRQAVRVFREIAAGLSHMHSRGFVHADMKPSNVLMTEAGHVKIIDLGQACEIGTIKKRIQGTPGYMAPEQAHRQACTERTDIYNFGAMMYWVLVRDVIPTALPPKDDNANSLFSGALDAAQVDPPVPPIEKDPGIHPLLSKHIIDCVQLDPSKRPDTMQVVADRLELIEDLLRNPPPSQPIGDDDDTSY